MAIGTNTDQTNNMGNGTASGGADTSASNTADPDYQKKQQNRGTGFTNINSILDANQGAGQKIGQTIGSGLTKQADSVRAGIEAGKQNFNTQSNQAGTQAKTAIKAGQNLEQTAGENNDAYAARIAGNTDVNGNPINYSSVGQGLQGANYNGPMGLQNADKLATQGMNATQQGQLAGTNAGQSQLLQTMVAKPGQYTQGMNALDQLLIGQSGQGAIQQGRRSTLGLQQSAQNAAANAAAQANALKTGISTDRADTLQALQGAATGDQGFKGQAQAATTKFQENASILQQILAGTYKPTTDAEKANAEDIVNHMEDYGVTDTSLYDKNDAAAQQAVASLGSQFNIPNVGGLKYSANQQQAGQNLADVLGDSALKNEFATNKYDTNVFGSADDQAKNFAGLNAAMASDQANKDKLTRYGTLAQGSEQYSIATQNAKLDAQNAYVQGNPNLSADQKAQFAAGINQQKDLISSQGQEGLNGNNTGLFKGFDPNSIFTSTGGDQNPGGTRQYSASDQAAIDAINGVTPDYSKMSGYDLSQNVQNQAFLDSLKGLTGTPVTSDQALAGIKNGTYSPAQVQAAIQAGMTGDYGVSAKDTTQPGWGNLWQGTGATTDANGNIRASDAFNTANKQMGQSQQMRDYILNKLRGSTEAPTSGQPRTLTQK